MQPLPRLPRVFRSIHQALGSRALTRSETHQNWEKPMRAIFFRPVSSQDPEVVRSSQTILWLLDQLACGKCSPFQQRLWGVSAPHTAKSADELLSLLVLLRSSLYTIQLTHLKVHSTISDECLDCTPSPKPSWEMLSSPQCSLVPT